MKPSKQNQSKRSKGAKAVFTPTVSRRDLVEMANEILLKNGEPQLVLRESWEWQCDIEKQRFDFTNCSTTPNPKIYSPTGSTEYKPPKEIISGNVCQGCRAPRHKHAASMCRACYSKKAKARADKKIEEKYERIDAYLQRYSSLELLYQDIANTHNGEEETQYIRVEPDFAPDLIETISRVEKKSGLMAFRWGRSLSQFPELLLEEFA